MAKEKSKNLLGRSAVALTIGCFLDIRALFKSLFRPYGEDADLKKLNGWDKAALKLPLLNAPLHLFIGLIAAPLFYLTVAPIAILVAGVVAIAKLCSAIASGPPRNMPAAGLGLWLLVCLAAVFIVPGIAVLAVAGAVCMPVVGAAVSVANLVAATLDIVMTPVSLITRSICSLSKFIGDHKPVAKPKLKKHRKRKAAKKAAAKKAAAKKAAAEKAAAKKAAAEKAAAKKADKKADPELEEQHQQKAANDDKSTFHKSPLDSSQKPFVADKDLSAKEPLLGNSDRRHSC